MSKRLEEVKHFVDLINFIPRDSRGMGEMDVVNVQEDMKWLIEQAEHVEELEDKCNYLSDMNEMLVDLNGVLPDEPELYIKLKKENKRYREAIEVAIHNMSGDNLGDKYALGILKQALEGEK